MKCLNTSIDSLLPVQEGSSITTWMTEQETINGSKLTVKHFNTSVAQHFYPIKITTTWNGLPNEVVTSRTVNSFKNSLENTGQKISQMSELTGSNHRCRAQFKCAQTVIGQRFAGNGPMVCPTTTATTITTTTTKFTITNTWTMRGNFD